MENKVKQFIYINPDNYITLPPEKAKDRMPVTTMLWHLTIYPIYAIIKMQIIV